MSAPFPYGPQTIFVAVAGSHAHGTAREGSDLDLRGVCIAPLDVRLSLFQSFEQYEGPLPDSLGDDVLPVLRAHPTATRSLGGKTECVIYDVAKFVALCAGANPNALEILFTDERDWLFATPAWQRLYDARQWFLTAKVEQTFQGYAWAQLKKIKTHRSWLLSPPAKQPSRADFGLPVAGSILSADDQHRIEKSVADRIRSYGIDTLDMPKQSRIAIQERLTAFYRDVLTATPDPTVGSDEALDDGLRAVAHRGLQLSPAVVSLLNAEKRYRAAMLHWDAYQRWKSQRNPARAELERQHGYDTKHAAHLVRLMRMGVEVFECGDLRVRRDDAAELSAIRDGALSFDALLLQAETLHERMAAAAKTASLPADVDASAVDHLVFELVTRVDP